MKIQTKNCTNTNTTNTHISEDFAHLFFPPIFNRITKTKQNQIEWNAISFLIFILLLLLFCLRRKQKIVFLNIIYNRKQQQKQKTNGKKFTWFEIEHINLRMSGFLLLLVSATIRPHSQWTTIMILIIIRNGQTKTTKTKNVMRNLIFFLIKRTT